MLLENISLFIRNSNREEKGSPHQDKLTNMPFVSTHTIIGILNFVNMPMDVAVSKGGDLQKAGQLLRYFICGLEIDVKSKLKK